MTLTEFLLTQFAIEEDGRARSLRDLAEATQHQGLEETSAFLTRESDRVLAECQAKRAIVELHGENATIPGRYILTCWVDNDDYPCTTLRLLALPYADHPDYHPGWRPDDTPSD